jgi:hypothetical protein
MLYAMIPTPFYNITACMTPSSVGFMLYAMILALPEINSPFGQQTGHPADTIYTHV